MTDFDALLTKLSQHHVDFIVVGGAAAIAHGLNFTLATSLGDIDMLGEIPGGGTYAALKSGPIKLHIFGTRCLCLSLPQLIRAKRAAGRPRDLEVLAELEAIEDERAG